MKRICVFLSANDVDEKYVAVAEGLGESIAKGNHDLVFGGSECGLMKILADTVRGHGGHVTGITMECLSHCKKDDLDTLIVAKDLHERKKKMLDHSDVIVALPGGIGTLDELLEIVELNRHAETKKQVVVIDVDGFYTGLKLQMQTMYQEEFIDKPYDAHMYFAHTVEEAMNHIEKNNA